MKIMKIKSIILLVLLSGATSCSYLDVVPEKMGTIEYAFRDRRSALQYLATCYHYLPSLGHHTNSIGRTCGTETTTYFRNRENGVKITLEGNSITNPMLAYWSGDNGGVNLYKGIRCCNTFLENVHLIRDLSSSEREQWSAEAKFLKAYYHWLLIQHYGPIVLVKENIPVSASPEEVRAFRTPVNECIDYVKQLLDEALYGESKVDDEPGEKEPPLPLIVGDEISENGRITRPIVAAMRAKIMVHAASPFFAENSMYDNFVDSRGIQLFPQCSKEEVAKRWADAAKACKEAIDICHEAGFQLYTFDAFNIIPAISEETRLIVQPSMVVTSAENNKENIWVDPMTDDTNLQKYCMPALNSGFRVTSVRAQLTPTLATAENFYSSNGVPIEEDKDWYDNGWYDNRYKTTTAPQETRLKIEPGKVVPYLNLHREPRFYGSLAFNGSKWYGCSYKVPDKQNSEDYQHTVASLAGDVAGNPAGRNGEQYYTATGYFTKKLVNYKTGLNDAGTSFVSAKYFWPNMRLADLYLLYAEALNESQAQPTPDIWEKWIDPIRLRSGLKGVEESWTRHSNKPDKFREKNGLRDIIHQERVIELALEGHFYYDMRRWSGGSRVDRYDIMTEMNQPVKGWNYDGTDDVSYNTIRTVYNISFSLRDYLWPIKESDIDKNPNLIQNPGW